MSVFFVTVFVRKKHIRVEQFKGKQYLTVGAPECHWFLTAVFQLPHTFTSAFQSHRSRSTPPPRSYGFQHPLPLIYG